MFDQNYQYISNRKNGAHFNFNTLQSNKSLTRYSPFISVIFTLFLFAYSVFSRFTSIVPKVINWKQQYYLFTVNWRENREEKNKCWERKRNCILSRSVKFRFTLFTLNFNNVIDVQFIPNFFFFEISIANRAEFKIKFMEKCVESYRHATIHYILLTVMRQNSALFNLLLEFLSIVFRCCCVACQNEKCFCLQFNR